LARGDGPSRLVLIPVEILATAMVWARRLRPPIASRVLRFAVAAWKAPVSILCKHLLAGADALVPLLAPDWLGAKVMADQMAKSRRVFGSLDASR